MKMDQDVEDVEDADLVLEEISIDDQENTAFLPGTNGVRVWGGRKDVCISSIASKTERLCKISGKLKTVIMGVMTLTAALAMLAVFSRQDSTLPENLPDSSVQLAQSVAEKLKQTAIPSYALTYAPIVVLDREETYFPSDLMGHIKNTQPVLNFTPISDAPSPLTLSNLDELNSYGGDDVYLSSSTPVVTLPNWLQGQKPSLKTLRTEKAKNCVIAVVEKDPIATGDDDDEQSVTDVFYLYFYSFNDGPRGLGRQVGNHVGDWEHNMIRFINGIPRAIWYSQHGFGAAYTYDAVQKISDRPVSFSARGSHSNWPDAKAHDFHDIDNRIPPHIAYDYTSVGRLWDPTLSAYFYIYNETDNILTSAKDAQPSQTGTYEPALASYPTDYLYFNGQWGDQQLRLGDPGQEEIYGFFKWSSGPKGIGWGDKVVTRETMCPKTSIPDVPGDRPNNDTVKKFRECVIRDTL